MDFRLETLDVSASRISFLHVSHIRTRGHTAYNDDSSRNDTKAISDQFIIYYYMHVIYLVFSDCYITRYNSLTNTHTQTHTTQTIERYMALTSFATMWELGLASSFHTQVSYLA